MTPNPDQPNPDQPTIVVLSGSPRLESMTRRVCDVVVPLIQAEGAAVELIDLAELTLAMPGADATPDATRLADTMRAADAVVLATPEYHGSYSAAIKQAIENLGHPSGLTGKPVALVGAAAGRIGAVKALEHLRSVCAHLGSHVLPGAVSVANVGDAFAEDGALKEDLTRDMMATLASTLVDQARSAAEARAV